MCEAYLLISIDRQSLGNSGISLVSVCSSHHLRLVIKSSLQIGAPVLCTLLLWRPLQSAIRRSDVTFILEMVVYGLEFKSLPDRRWSPNMKHHNLMKNGLFLLSIHQLVHAFKHHICDWRSSLLELVHINIRKCILCKINKSKNTECICIS